MSNTWRHHAACAGADDAVFFPSIGAGNALARSICAECPVRLACLADCLAAEGNQRSSRRYGVYAGLTGDERARLGGAS